MYTLCVKFDSGEELTFVSGRLRPLREVMLKQAPANYGVVTDWRLHDGSGWADGTEDAWKYFNYIAGRTATIVPY